MSALKSVLSLSFSAAKAFILFPVYFISGCFRRNKRRVAFGCHLSKPAGNIFHYFKHCVETGSPAYEFKWVASNQETYDYIASAGYPAVKKNSCAGVWWCLTSGYYCYSSYVSDISYFLCKGVRGVNVWHGTPLKKIEFDIDTGIYSLRYKYQWFFSLLQPWVFFKPYKVFVSSDYESECFRTAFRIDENIMFKTFPPRLVGFERVKNTDGKQHILIAPTFRDGASLQYNCLVDFERLDRFAQENSIVFYVKAHPSDVSLMNFSFDDFQCVVKVDRLVDIYAVVSRMDAVITDYSSIFFDCSYTDVPFFLHWPDVAFYNASCRGFYFDAKQDFKGVYSDNMNGLLENIQYFLTKKGAGKVEAIEKFSCYGLASGYPLSVFGVEPK